MLICCTLMARMFSMDRLLLSLSLYLCILGIPALAVPDASAALAHALRVAASLAALLAGAVLIRSLSSSVLTSLCTGFLGVLLLAVFLVSPGRSLPLSEAALALLLISFASCLSRGGSLTALLPAAAGLALLLAQNALADAVLWTAVFLLLLWASDGRLLPMLLALGTAGLLFFGFRLLVPLSQPPAQESSALPALLSGGWVGADPLPEEFPSFGDSLLPRLAGLSGLPFAGLTVVLVLPLVLRGTAVASSARARFHGLIAMGASLFIGLRTLAALLSLFGFLPLPGLAFPLLTVSLPSLCAQMFLLGLVCGIAGRNEADLAEDAHLAMLAR